MMMLLAPTLLAFAVLGFADYVRVLAPSLPEIPVAAACLVFATGAAMLRVRTGAILTGVFLCIELMALAIVSVVAIVHPARSVATVLAHPVVLQHGALNPVTAATMSIAIVTGVFTCGGASWALYFGEELKDAPRRIGGVIGWAGLIAAVLIAAPLFLVVTSMSDPKQVLAADAPVADYMTHVAGRGLASLVSVGLVIAVFNAIVAMIMSYSRLFYATGRDGIWPAPVNQRLSRLHPGLRSPIGATAVLCGATALFMLLGEQFLLILSSGENISEFLLMAAAVIIGRRIGKTGANFRTLLHPLIPILAILAAITFAWADWMDPAAGRPSLVILAVLSVGSLVYYRLRGKPWTLGGAPIGEEPRAADT
jgi:amino acid transporter